MLNAVYAVYIFIYLFIQNLEDGIFNSLATSKTLTLLSLF